MGIILSGILSGVSGKVAGVVGGRWKDKHYLRAYTIPANPNTAAQQTQRTKFRDVVDFAKPLVGQVFNAYTDKFQKSMSGFNFFIKRNIDIFDGSPVWGQIKITEGPLSFPMQTGPTYSTPNITIPWTKNLGNNGLDSDDTFAVVYDTSTGIFYFAPITVPRGSENMSFPIDAGLTATDLEVYIWCAQEVNNILERISFSWHLQAS